MNERIKELAEQAEQYADDTMNADPATYDKAGQVKVWRELMQAKFAELIVREVLDQVDEFSRLTKAYQKQGIDPEIDVTKEVLKNLEFPRFPRS